MKKQCPRLPDFRNPFKSSSLSWLRMDRWKASLLTPFFVLAILVISGNLVFAQDATEVNKNIYLPIISGGNPTVNVTDEPPFPDAYDSQQPPVIDENANSGRTICITNLKITNQSSYTIKVYWVNLFGGEMLYNSLSPNAYYWQLTLWGNKWRVRSISGALLKEFYVTSCLFQYVTITNSNFPSTPTATPTKTPILPTATATKTPIPPTATATNTPIPPTATPTNTPTPPLTADLGNQVWFDLNGNGTQQIDEPYVPNITVQLLQGCTGDVVLDTQITDVNGFYTFYAQTPGQYRVRFSNIPAGYQFTAKDVGSADNIDSDVDADGLTDCVTVVAGVDNPTVDAGIVSLTDTTASLSGVAWYDANGNGIRESGEAFVLDAQLTLYKGCSSTNIFAAQVTDLNGVYTFPALPAGQYRLQVVQDANFTISPKDQGDDMIDSDFDPTTTLNDCFNLIAGSAPAFDVGFIPVN
ncbi:MAG: SdrD B-like domain-containing protein [Caldilineaceae bacterium]